MFNWAKFQNHWDLLLSEYAKRREKETQKVTAQKAFINHILLNKKHQFRHVISGQVKFWFTKNWMQALNNENKLEVDEKKKN